MKITNNTTTLLLHTKSKYFLIGFIAALSIGLIVGTMVVGVEAQEYEHLATIENGGVSAIVSSSNYDNGYVLRTEYRSENGQDFLRVSSPTIRLVGSTIDLKPTGSKSYFEGGLDATGSGAAVVDEWMFMTPDQPVRITTGSIVQFETINVESNNLSVSSLGATPGQVLAKDSQSRQVSGAVKAGQAHFVVDYVESSAEQNITRIVVSPANEAASQTLIGILSGSASLVDAEGTVREIRATETKWNVDSQGTLSVRYHALDFSDATDFSRLSELNLQISGLGVLLDPVNIQID